MCINAYIAIIEELVTFSVTASCILVSLHIHRGRHFLSPPQMSPLHWAADKGHVNIVKFLVEKGANLHCEDGLGVSE